MKFWGLICGEKSSPSNPGVNWYFIFLKNSLRKRLLKLWTVDCEVCSADSVCENTKNSGLFSWDNEEVPLNPRIHPVKEVLVIPV